ncbi:hypothetical protein GTP45_01120 [Pseudoduganella sp. FT55W]|uniref:Uncharacterized protein n=1 Tax=Duganella rivi TaxID=2666083 RepID=A0A7X4GL47_9BURK|nr:hypothetical protein [Duganella rivi]MYM65433.1 hypothetical protein [Duganella rivi]
MSKSNDSKSGVGKSADTGALSSDQDQASLETRPLDEQVVEQPEHGGSFVRCPKSGALTRVETEPAQDAK